MGDAADSQLAPGGEPRFDASADKAPASAEGVAEKEKPESCFWHAVKLLTHAFGGDHATWSHPVVIIMLISTLAGCCYGVAQNWQKSVAARTSPGLRTKVIGPMPSFPSWVVVVCTDTVPEAPGVNPLNVNEYPWNIASQTAQNVPPPLSISGGKDAAPPPPPVGGSPKSAPVTRSQAMEAGRHSATRAAVTRMARAKLAEFQAAPAQATGRRLQTQTNVMYTSTSTSSDDGVYYSEVYGECYPFTASASASATTNTTTCSIPGPTGQNSSPAIDSCWLYVQTCGCHGDTMLRFFDNASPYRALGDVDDGGGSWCSASSSSSSYDTQNSLCSAGATDISSYGIDSNGVAVDVDIKQGCYGSTACGGTVLFFYLCTSDGNFEITLDNSFTNEVNEDDEVSSAAVELEVSSANASTGTAAYAYASGTCDEYTSSLSSSASTNATTCTVEFLRDSDFPDCAAYIWSCGCSGDTYVRVEQASGALLAGMDDDSMGWCTSSDYRCSSGSIALPTGVSQLNLRQGCFSQGTCGGVFNWYLTCTGTAASSGSGGSPSTTPTTPIFSAPPENYNSENNDNSTSYGPTSVYTYTSTDPSTNTVYTYAYGGCDPFYQSAGTGFSACDVYAPAMDEASTCEIRLYGCY